MRDSHARNFLGWALALMLPACSPTHPRSLVAPIQPESGAPASPGFSALGPAVAPANPEQAQEAEVSATTPLDAPKITRRTASGVLFEGVSFDSRTHRMLVVDQPHGPGSRFADASAAASANGGIAAVNAGFFTPEGEPLGLVTSRGRPAGTWNSASSLGSGIWYEDSNGRSAISRRESLGKAGAAGMRELIQAGPVLIDEFRPVSGLESTKSSMRIVMLWDGRHRWWVGRAGPCTLDALANAIASGNPAGWNTRKALNLDGGRSADLWISGSLSGGPIQRRPAWNRQVRNFLVVAPR